MYYQFLKNRELQILPTYLTLLAKREDEVEMKNKCSLSSFPTSKLIHDHIFLICMQRANMQ